MTPIVDWDPTERTRSIAYRLVQWPSETGSPGEAAFADRLADLLREIPYFRDHPADIAILDSHGSPPARNVVAVVRGTGRRTVAFAGHYDVVSTGNYRELQHLAFDPDALREALLADLSARPLAPHEERARADLLSGDFIPGRGMLDMKSGIAAGIAALEHFSHQEQRQGNLILLATPDEEVASRGMRSLRDALPDLMARWQLDIVGAINLDATSDQGDGLEGQAIYRGSIGKDLPFAFVVGQPSHASYPFEGVSAHLIAAEIIRDIEANVDFCDRDNGDLSPPPVCLEALDFRAGYEVTTPERVWVAFNWLSHNRSPQTLMSLFRTGVQEALERAMVRFNANAGRYARDAGTPHSGGGAGRLLGIADLRGEVLRVAGEEALQQIDALGQDAEGSGNPLRVSRDIVDRMVTAAQITGPAVIVGLASLHYPHVHLDQHGAAGAAFATAIETVRQHIEGQTGCRIKYRDYFIGISDMSFLGNVPAPASQAAIAEDTAAACFVDRAESRALSFPAVNIGPWGREYHQRLERLFAPYAFTVLPAFIHDIAREYLGAS